MSEKETKKKSVPTNEVGTKISTDVVNKEPKRCIPRIGNVYLTDSVHKSTNGEMMKTFSGIPLDNHTAFLELMFDPETKVLGVITKNKKIIPQFIPKVDNLGLPKQNTGRNAKDFPFFQERVLVEAYHEQYIRTKEQIDEFLNMHAINLDYDWMQFLK